MEIEASARQVNRDGSTILLIIIVLVLYLAVG
jgi:flagellar basal body-associated protein FliL